MLSVSTTGGLGLARVWYGIAAFVVAGALGVPPLGAQSLVGPRMRVIPRPRPTPRGPRIVSLTAKPPIVHSGQTIVWDVRTTTDVVSVTTSVTIYSFPLVRVAPGHFALTFGIPPDVPSVFHGNYDMDVVAKDAAGHEATRHILLRFE